MCNLNVLAGENIGISPFTNCLVAIHHHFTANQRKRTFKAERKTFQSSDLPQTETCDLHQYTYSSEKSQYTLFYRQSVFLSQPHYTHDFSNFSLTLSLLSAKNNRICCLDHDQFTASEGPTPVYHSKNSETTIQLPSLNNEGSYNLQAVVLPAQFEFVESFHFSEKI